MTKTRVLWALVKPQVCSLGKVKASRFSYPCKFFVELLSVLTGRESTESNESTMIEPGLCSLKAVPRGFLFFIYYM